MKILDREIATCTCIEEQPGAIKHSLCYLVTFNDGQLVAEVNSVHFANLAHALDFLTKAKASGNWPWAPSGSAVESNSGFRAALEDTVPNAASIQNDWAKGVLTVSVILSYEFAQDRDVSIPYILQDVERKLNAEIDKLEERRSSR